MERAITQSPDQPGPPIVRSWLALARKPMLTASWVISLAVLACAVVLSSRWLGQTSIPVTVSVDDEVELVYSKRPDVRALLDDLGLRVRPEDVLVPSVATSLTPGLSVSLHRARPYQLRVDGTVRELLTHGQTVGDLLSEAAVRLYSGDEVWLSGAFVATNAQLPASSGASSSSGLALPRAWTRKAQLPVLLEVRRALPLVVDDGSVPFVISTTAPTVGEALLREGVLVYLGDTVRPGLGTRVRADMRVVIERSKSLLVATDGHSVRTRTKGDTVGDALVDLGIIVSGSDRTIPPLADPVVDSMEIQVVRVLETVQVERKMIPYESVMAPDDKLELDRQRLSVAGSDGEFRRRFSVAYEDGVESSRSLIDEWVAAEPVTRVVSYGRKIVSRSLETPEGPLSYWRKVEMYATAYSAATSGTPRSAPWYGRTRIGLQLRKGLVAVDPKVVPLGTRLYVPGYGVALAADTGGGVRGRMIDLGYDDGQVQPWHWWVDVYVLDPPPSSSVIAWVLPKYPGGRFPYRRN
jgi:resuscitation-promoting factor RpfB